MDLHCDIPDGKNKFEGTPQVVFQKNTIAVPNLIINRTDPMKPIVNPIKVEIKDKPSLRGESFPSFLESLDLDVEQQYKKKDQIWYLCQVMEEKMTGILPTCSGYNSLASSAQYPCLLFLLA